MTEWGNRCQVCTGCGRCAPGGKREEQMKVITASFFLPERRETEGNALGKGGGGPEEEALELTECLWLKFNQVGELGHSRSGNHHYCGGMV